MTGEHRAPDDPASPPPDAPQDAAPPSDAPHDEAVEPATDLAPEGAPDDVAPDDDISHDTSAADEAAADEPGQDDTTSAEAAPVEGGPEAVEDDVDQDAARAPRSVPPADVPPRPAPGTSSVSRSWRTIARALAPRATRAQVLAGLLCALLGFAFVVQVQQNRSDGLSSLRQDELVRILDEVTQRTEELEDQAAELRAQRAELASGSDTRRAAREAATERAAQQGILAGRLPAQGPGVVLTVRDPERRVPALVLYNVLEELRNAGAEAVQLNDLRLTASTYVVDTVEGVQVDGTLLEPPYRWVAIGDPDVIIPALNMPGGALAVVRGSDGQSEVEARDLVQVTAVRDVEPPRHATPAPATEDG